MFIANGLNRGLNKEFPSEVSSCEVVRPVTVMTKGQKSLSRGAYVVHVLHF